MMTPLEARLIEENAALREENERIQDALQAAQEGGKKKLSGSANSKVSE